MGRKVSIKERAATNAALEILETTNNQNLKAQVAKLLFESDAREKARVDARERQRRASANSKELADLGSQISSLKEQLQAKEDTITSLKAENEKAIRTSKDQIAGKEKVITELAEKLKTSQTALSECSQKAGEQLSRIASYVGCPEYDPKVLSQYLKEQKAAESRTAALAVIVSDKSLPQDRRRKLALEITQHHKYARQLPPLKQFVDQVKSELGFTRDEDLEPDYARWYRNGLSDDPVFLLKRVGGMEVELSREDERLLARRMLELFYGWTEDLPGLDLSHWEREVMFDKLRAVKKRSLEEVEQIIQAETESKRSREDWQR